MCEDHRVKLPVMRCDSGCGDCCGLAPVTDQEYKHVVEYAQQNGITPLEQGVTCPFYQKGTCQVYPVRPLVCRIFGHTEKLPCSRGYNTNLPDRKIQKMVRHNGQTTRMLHEVLGTEASERLLADLAASVGRE
jgi:Fe-S-cluster containining protein